VTGEQDTQNFDLDKVLAERKKTPPFQFTFDGERYVLPGRPDVRAAAAMSAGRLDDGFRLLLGPDQWDKLQASPKVFDDDALITLMEAYQAHSGEDLGEFRASTNSSSTTVKR
jgi:hypothetical protein